MIKLDIFLFLILFSLSCNKGEMASYDYWGNASALKNNILWTPKVLAMTNEPHGIGIDVLLDLYNEKNINTEMLFFYKIPFKTGRYALSITKKSDIDGLVGVTHLRFVEDGEVFGARYELNLNDSIEDYIEITMINGIELSGNFSASFQRIFENGDPDSPEFAHFVEGEFFTRLQK